MSSTDTSHLKIFINRFCLCSSYMACTSLTLEGRKCKRPALINGKCCVHHSQTCAVCLDPVPSLTSYGAKRLSCTHAFHTSCIMTWFETNADRAESEMSPVPWSRDTRDTSLLCAVHTWFHHRRRSGDIEPHVGLSLGTSAYNKTIFSFTVIPSAVACVKREPGVRVT